MIIRRQLRQKRKASIRARLSGTAKVPRLAVYRSNTRLSAQIIDDVKAVSLASAWVKGKNNASAVALGEAIAVKAKAAGIKKVVFDRGGFRYHGSIKQVAEKARAGGLIF
ncbi:MAG: 50S ribosomal protein L18 [Patescibacteria group bacterium]